MKSDYHQSITVMPNGSVYSGEYDSQNSYPNAPLLARYIKDRKTGLVAKTLPFSKKVAALTALIAKTGGQLDAATTIADSSNLSHLQMIRLYPEAQGVPTEYFFLDEMFVPRDVPMLQARETFYDTTATAQYRGRLEESTTTKTNYDEISYNLLKLTDKVFTPIEDIMRTIINPQEVDLSQLRWGFKWKRNQSAAAALATISNSLGSIHDPTLMSGGGVQSEYNVANQLNGYLNTFLTTEDVKITHLAWNPSDFANYTMNTWTKQGPLNIEPIRLVGGGVTPCPGLQGVTAVVDSMVPAGTIYAVNKPNAMRLGEGPKIMRRYYDEERDAEAIKVIDFHQYLNVNTQLSNITREFSATISILSGS